MQIPVSRTATDLALDHMGVWYAAAPARSGAMALLVVPIAVCLVIVTMQEGLSALIDTPDYLAAAIFLVPAIANPIVGAIAMLSIIVWGAIIIRRALHRMHLRGIK